MNQYILSKAPEGKHTDLEFMRICLNGASAIGHELVTCYQDAWGNPIFVFRVGAQVEALIENVERMK